MKLFRLLKKVIFVWLTTILIVSQIFAHGGEDHGDSGPKTVSNAKGLITKTANVGGFEILLKFPEIEPDTPSHASIFVTKTATNEAVENAKVTLSIGENQIVAKPTDKKGIFTVDLPPIPAGNTKLSATLNVANKTDTANLGTLEIALQNHETILEINGWAKTGLWILGGILGLMLIGFVVWFFSKQLKTEEIVSA